MSSFWSVKVSVDDIAQMFKISEYNAAGTSSEQYDLITVLARRSASAEHYPDIMAPSSGA